MDGRDGAVGGICMIEAISLQRSGMADDGLLDAGHVKLSPSPQLGDGPVHRDALVTASAKRSSSWRIPQDGDVLVSLPNFGKNSILLRIHEALRPAGFVRAICFMLKKFEPIESDHDCGFHAREVPAKVRAAARLGDSGRTSDFPL